MDKAQASVPMTFQLDVYQPGYIEAGSYEATRVTVQGSEADALVILRALCDQSAALSRVEIDPAEELSLTTAITEGVRDGSVEVQVGSWKHALTVLGLVPEPAVA